MKNLILATSVIFMMIGCNNSSEQLPAEQSLGINVSASDILKELSLDSTIELGQEFSGNLYKNAGGFITVDSAKLKLERGRAIGNVLNQPYGFVFGLDTLDKFIKNIRDVNALYKKDTIEAVRIYLVKTHRKSVTAPYRRFKHFDVMMVPVVSDGSNFFNLGDVVDSLAFTPDYPGVLNNSLPCPDECP